MTWRSKKQPLVERSNAETEYRGMAFRVCELLWLRNLLLELGTDSQEIMKLYCDNHFNYRDCSQSSSTRLNKTC